MPRIDLHRHLEGATRPTTILELAHRDGHWLARHEHPEGELSADGPLPGLLPYLAKIDNAMSAVNRLDDWRRVAAEVVEDAADDGLDYLEVRFSPRLIAQGAGVAGEAAIDAVADGVFAASRERDIPVRLIGILVRTFGPGECDRDLASILARRGIVTGIDLAGDEAGWPAELFASHFERARSAGLRSTAHAGEAAGPNSVAAALDHLRPERIGHGARSAEDPRLMERLAVDGVTLELAVTSNVHTRAAPSVGEHQLVALLAAGVPVTVNTDNPTASATRLSAEYEVARAAGLSVANLDRVAEQAAHAAFLSEGKRRRLLAR